MFYVETKGSRWAIMAADYPSLERALEAARLPNTEGTHRLVWDCSNNPRGTLVRTIYADGTEVSA